MNRLEHFQRFYNFYGLVILALFLVINAAVLGSSVVMEESRSGAELPFRLWDPFVWEYSSAVSILLLVPLLHIYLDKYPLSWLKPGRSVLTFLILALLFSIGHVGLMVGIRKLVYLLQGRSYIFGSLPFEFIYEFRKDFMTFSLFLILRSGYQFIASRLMSEVSLVEEKSPGISENESALISRDRLLVKKLGKEFIVKLHDVEWMEASGNYINLHIQERVYPIRKTLSSFIEEVGDKGFCRIHRSHAINLDAIDHITPLPSGDAELKLKSGKTLNISRRYKEELKQCLL